MDLSLGELGGWTKPLLKPTLPKDWHGFKMNVLFEKDNFQVSCQHSSFLQHHLFQINFPPTTCPKCSICLYDFGINKRYTQMDSYQFATTSQVKFVKWPALILRSILGPLSFSASLHAHELGLQFMVVEVGHPPMIQTVHFLDICFIWSDIYIYILMFIFIYL